MVAGAQTVSQAVTHSGADLDEGEEAAAALQSKIISITVTCTMKGPCTCCVACEYSRFPFLLAAWDVSPGLLNSSAAIGRHCKMIMKDCP